jgi:CheY-like chemotaxis protein
MYTTNSTTAVLVIDDCPDDVLLLQLAARECHKDIRFYPVKDGDEAKAYLTGDGEYSDRRLHPLPAIILLDMSLGGLGSREFLVWLRAVLDFSALPVVVWTGSDDHRAITRALAAGANRVVRKPSDREGLAKLIAEMACEVAEERVSSPSRTRLACGRGVESATGCGEREISGKVVA